MFNTWIGNAGAVARKRRELEQQYGHSVPRKFSQPESAPKVQPAAPAAVEPRTQAPTVPEKTSAQKRDEAKALYDSYMRSDERKQNVAAAHKAQTDAWMTAAITGSADTLIQPIKDQKEQELKALVDHYEAQVQREESQGIMDADLQELAGWNPEERRALDEYILGNNQAFYEAINPTGGGPRARVLPEGVVGIINKYGQDKVDKLAESVRWSRNAELTQQTAEEAQAGLGSAAGVLGHNITSVAANTVGGLSGLFGYLQELGASTGRYPTMDPNNIGNLPQVYSGAVRGKTAQNIEENIGGGWGKAASLGYQGVMSMADSYARALAGGGSVGAAALAASGTFSQTMSEASAQGATPGQAVLLATTKAAIEAASEKIPLDNLLEAAKTGGKGLGTALIDAFAQAGVEMTTEEISLFGSVLAEAAILKEKAGYQQQVNALVAEGMDLQAARDEAARGLLWEAAETAAVSGISGAASSAAATMAGNIRNRGNAESIGQQMDADGEQDTTTSGQDATTEKQDSTISEQTRTDAAMEETAAQWAQDAPKEVPKKKTDADLQIDQAYKATVGAGQETGSQPQTNAISNPLESYPAEKQNSIRSYMKSVDENIKSFVQRVKSGDTTFKRQKIADVNARVVKDVGNLLGIDAGGYTHNINTNGVQHIINRHGENGEQDHSMALDDDIARLGWVLENYDSVELLTENGEQVYSSEFRDSNDRPAPQIRFVKKIDGHYFVVEAACENKHKKLWVQSAYLQKNNGDVTQAPAEGPSANHETNARSALASPSPDSSLPQNGKEVNGNIDEGRAQEVENGKIKGTGAAERNFSGKAEYQELLSDDNAQPDRPGDVRPMEVPKKDAYGRDVTEFAANAYGAAATPDRMANEIEQLIQDGALGFDRISNEEALNNARDAIYGTDSKKGRGESRTMTDIRKNIYNGKIQDGDIEKALLLYTKFANRKSESSLDNAAELMVDLSTMAHMTGRNLQLFKLLRRMTPEGQLLAVQRSVERHAEEMIRKGQVKKGYEPSIDQELMDDYLSAAKELEKADTPAKQKDAEKKVKAAEEAIYQAEAAKMPATFKAKWDAWRYMCMLGNVKTQVRNLGGNVMFMPYKAAKDAIGAGLERAFIEDKGKRTKAVIGFSEGDQQLLNWAKADRKSDAVQDALRYSAKLGDDVSDSKLEENMRVFDTEALERVRKFVEKVPTETDLFFKNGYYERSLAGFLKARGYTAADIQSGKVSEAVLNEGRALAIEEAMKATFNDYNAFSDYMSSIGRNPVHKNNPVAKAMNVMGEAVLPFRRTPANIVVRFEEYSPVGIINTLVKGAKHIRNGDVSAASVIDSLASSVTGTGALVLGYMMAKGLAGIKLTGSLEDEDEKRQGHQAYALEFSLGGEEYSYKIDWAAPANLPLFVGANLYNLLASESNEDASVSKFTSFLYSVGTMFEPMLALSCLSSLNSLLETGKYSDGNAIYAVAAQAATSYLTQGIPALARQTVQAFQRNKQTTFTNSTDPLVRDLQQLAAATGIVPALKTDAIDEWGQTEDQGNFLVRAFNAYINPGTGKRIDNSELEQEITRLNDSQPDSVSPPDTPKTISYTDSSGEQHKSHRLTEEEYNTLATVQGETAKEILDQVLESETYAAMTDRQKADVFRCVYDYAREKGRGAALPGYDGMDSWMKDIEGNAVEGILDKAMKNAFTDAFDQLGGDPAGAAEALEQAYGLIEDSYDARVAFADAAGGRIKYFITARRSGVDAETFVDLYGKFREIDGNGELNTSGKAAQWSYELQRAQEAGAITDRQKKVLKDSMVYYQMFPAETAKFDEMTEGGISADKALDIGRLMEGIKPQEGYKDVRNNQKAAAIAGSDLSPAEKTAAMKAYLPANQDENLDLMLALGYSPDDYAAVYDIYANSKKAQAIEGIRKELGVDYATARKIYDIYG